MKYDFVNTNISMPDTPMFQIHKPGCKDVSRLVKNGGNRQQVESVSAAEFIARDLDAEMRESGYSESDYKVMPCTGEKTK